MNVDKIDVQLTPRSAYEAQDLGLQLLRRNAGATFAAVAAVMVPIWLTLLALDAPAPGLSLFAIWWLKPLMDRIALHVLSRSVFGDAPRLSATLASLPGVFDRALLAALTWRRFQLRRSLWTPIASLEGVRGKALRERQRVLEQRGTQGAAIWSTIVYFHLEFGLWIALYAVVSTFLPNDLVPGLVEMFSDEAAAESLPYRWVSALVWLPVLLLVETLYVAAGFGLYLCRRSQLEGWDIELAFGRLAARIRETAGRGLAVAIWFALGALALAPGAGARAVSQDAGQLDPREVARRVLEHPDFATETTQETLVPSFRGGGGDGLNLGGLLAPLLTVVAAMVLVAIVVALIVYLAKRVEAPRERQGKPRAEAPTEAFGLDLRPESLPDDVAEAAAALVRRGEFVAALSLLYRGALARLVEDDHLEIGPGDTEHDCMARVRGAADDSSAPRAGYFARLTESWLRAAWGAAPPGAEAALLLCDGWRSHFRRPA